MKYLLFSLIILASCKEKVPEVIWGDKQGFPDTVAIIKSIEKIVDSLVVYDNGGELRYAKINQVILSSRHENTAKVLSLVKYVDSLPKWFVNKGVAGENDSCNRRFSISTDSSFNSRPRVEWFYDSVNKKTVVHIFNCDSLTALMLIIESLNNEREKYKPSHTPIRRL